MSRKVTWKKGMRLSSELFTAADNDNYETLRSVALLASTGRMGLYASSRGFELSVNINNNTLEVTSLSCCGITRSGRIVDICFSSDYSNTFDTRLTIPAGNDGGKFLIVVKMHDGQWREVNDTYSEAKYTFELLAANSAIDDNSLPVGCIVNQYGWRLNDVDFVPPCLYIAAHPLHVKQYNCAKTVLQSVANKCREAKNCVAITFMSVVWPQVCNAYLWLERDFHALTPSQLFVTLQQFVNAFVIGCQLDSNVNLEDQEPFCTYVRKSFDVKNAYADIEQGLALCTQISTKVDAVCAIVENTLVPEPPKPREEPPKPSSGRNRWAGLEI